MSGCPVLLILKFLHSSSTFSERTVRKLFPELHETIICYHAGVDTDAWPGLFLWFRRSDMPVANCDDTLLHKEDKYKQFFQTPNSFTSWSLRLSATSTLPGGKTMAILGAKF